MENIYNTLQEIELKYNVKIIYCTFIGSKLYGTNSKTSDTDIKFLYIPNKRDILLKKDIDHIQIGNQNTEKNTNEDIDFEGWSIYKFFNLLKKSDTGAVDILFSTWSSNTIIYESTDFIKIVKLNYLKLLNKNMKSFIGYALGQAKRFGIKGARYNELQDFVNYLKSFPESSGTPERKISEYFESFERYIEENNCKYIKFIDAPGPKRTNKLELIPYITVLGKMFEGNVTNEYFFSRIIELENQFGNRTRSTSETDSKTDWKALSHAYRISYEVKELLTTKFIKFPLQNSEYIKTIKYGEINSLRTDVIISEIQDILDDVDLLLLQSDLPEDSDSEVIDEIILLYVGEV